jgi:probable F420-dependent oxidoreductase
MRPPASIDLKASTCNAANQRGSKIVKVETLLPLGKIDPGLRAVETPLDISRVGADARLVEEMGYDGLVTEETKDDPYVVMALAAQATTRLRLVTGVAMAFPRSPTITAMSAWSLQKLSKGRFTLGLGSQVKGHIQRRFGMNWSPPGPWMREYVLAVRAIWAAWQTGAPLDVKGAHYNINLMVPLFTPAPIEHPAIPVHLAAVNPYMCQIAGEVAEGIRPHPVCTPKYIEEVMLPSVHKGAAKVSRKLDRFAVCIKPLVATAPNEKALKKVIEDVRARVAFYASTPAYTAAFEAHGFGDLAKELATYSRAKRWNEMTGLIADDVLHTYATVGTWDEIVDKLHERYGRIVTHVEFSIPIGSTDDKIRLMKMVERLKAT